MGYRWLENYHSDSKVIEATPGVFTIGLKGEAGRDYPLFGVSIESVVKALERGQVQQTKLKELLEKMQRSRNVETQYRTE